MRTIASCVSNMNSASARASSVLPTPVGPRNRKVPIGRSGSCSPARERRSALETAPTASSWPMTRSCRRSSMWTSFSTSPSMQAADRDAGPAGHDLGDVLGVDLVLEEAQLARLVARASSSASRRLELGDAPVLQLGGAAEVGLALGALELGAGLLELALDVARRRSIDVLLALPLGGHRARAAPRGSASSASIASRRASRRVVGLLASAPGCSISSCMIAALDLVDLGRARSRPRCAAARRPRR